METKEQFVEQLAELGGMIYTLADNLPEIESSEDFQQMMFYLNKLSYRMINGKDFEGGVK